MALASINHEESYKRIIDYTQFNLDKMPQATALVKVNRIQVLDTKIILYRFVVVFPAIRDGFNNRCRPFIGINGCHLKGPYEGVLLPAVALDRNTKIYQLAVCIYDSKNIISTWTWFLGHLKNFLNSPYQLTFMCDKQKSIQTTLPLQFPNAHV